MGVKYDFLGEKGERKIVKSVTVSEESYKVLQKLVSKKEMSISETKNLDLISDLSNIFGGNCYDNFIRTAMQMVLAQALDILEENGCLKCGVEDCFEPIVSTFMPIICRSFDDKGERESLCTFETEKQPILNVIKNYFNPDVYKVFEESLNKAIKVDKKPVGEIAFFVLWSMFSEINGMRDEDEKVPVLNINLNSKPN